MSGWKSSLAAVGLAAAVYSLNTEEVPLTGRKQLLFRWYQPTGHGSSSLPKLNTSISPTHSPLHQQGLQLVQSLYQKAAEATEVVASDDPALQRRLATLPASADVEYDGDLQPRASFWHGQICTWHRLWGSSCHKETFTLRMTAGMLLSQDSAKGLQSIMGHEVGHGIARHLDEQKSCKMLIAATVFGRLALCGMRLVPTVAIGYVITRAVCKVGVDVWLSQKQEHEADVLGAAISKVSGCSTDDVIAALARLDGCARCFKERFLSSQQEKYLSLLQQQLPGIHIPNVIMDSASLTAFVKSIQGDLDSASAETRTAAERYLQPLWFGVVLRIYFFQAPHHLSSHPQLVDRVATIRNSSLLGCSAPYPAGHHAVEAQLHTLTSQLHAFQASPDWHSYLVAKSEVDDAVGLGGSCVDEYQHLNSILIKSQQSVLDEVAEQASEVYSLPSKAAAFFIGCQVDYANVGPLKLTRKWIIDELIWFCYHLSSLSCNNSMRQSGRL